MDYLPTRKLKVLRHRGQVEELLLLNHLYKQSL